jgi:hypothetical protein
MNRIQPLLTALHPDSYPYLFDQLTLFSLSITSDCDNHEFWLVVLVRSSNFDRWTHLRRAGDRSLSLRSPPYLCPPLSVSSSLPLLHWTVTIATTFFTFFLRFCVSLLPVRLCKSSEYPAWIVKINSDHRLLGFTRANKMDHCIPACSLEQLIKLTRTKLPGSDVL